MLSIQLMPHVQQYDCWSWTYVPFRSTVSDVNTGFCRRSYCSDFIFNCIFLYVIYLFTMVLFCCISCVYIPGFTLHRGFLTWGLLIQYWKSYIIYLCNNVAIEMDSCISFSIYVNIPSTIKHLIQKQIVQKFPYMYPCNCYFQK